MGNVNYELVLPCGYEIKEYCGEYDIKTAEKILMSRKQRKVSCAERDGMNAKIYSHRLICPHCFYSLPAYARYLNGSFLPIKKARQRLPKEKIREWASLQTSLFDDEKRGISLNMPEYLNGEFVCPNCNRKSKPSKRYRKVNITLQEQKITVITELIHLEEILSLKLNSEFPFLVSLPIYEKVVFDIKNAEVYLELYSDTGYAYLRKSLTENKTDYTTCFLYKRIKWDKKLQRILRKVFEHVWGTALPFDKKSFGFEEMILSSFFVGYNKEFYYAIPFKKGSFDIDKSFLQSAKKIRSVGDAIIRYQTSSLPDIKSVKRIFFKNAGLFFYMDEAEKLYEIIRDPNYFCKLLNFGNIYSCLSILHQRPAVFSFLEDYAKEMGEEALVTRIYSGFDSLVSYAVNYSSMNESLKSEERRNWHGCKMLSEFRGIIPNFSLPMPVFEDIIETEIDRFLFKPLKSIGEYYDVGKKLSNCLCEWRPKDSSVFSVEKDSETVAAIEISKDKMLVQVKAEKNTTIHDIGEEFIGAFKKWKEKYKIIEETVEVEPDEDFVPIDFERLYRRRFR